MQKYFEHQFLSSDKSNFLAERLGGNPFTLGSLESGERLGSNLKRIGGGLLAGFDARLVVGVDTQQASVESDRALEERDEHSHSFGIHLLNCERNARPAVTGKGLTCSKEEGLKVIA